MEKEKKNYLLDSESPPPGLLALFTPNRQITYWSHLK